jgi:hypothetical protein
MPALSQTKPFIWYQSGRNEACARPQIDGIHCGNPQALQQYKERRRRIEQLRQEMTDQQTSLESRNAAIEAKKVPQSTH